MTAGRPTLYKPEYAEQARKLCRLGATDSQVADFFEIGTTTFYRWRQDHPDFAEAVTEGKQICDNQVEQALHRRAVGFEYEAVRVFMPAGAPAPVLVSYPVQVIPDVRAAQHWLRFRRPREWSDRSEEPEHGAFVERFAKAMARVEEGRVRDRLDSGG
jgi:hypothetical protein